MKIISPPSNRLRVAGMLLDKGSDQAQQFLLFWTVASAQEGWEVLMFHVPTRGQIGFMADEDGSRGLPDQVPAVAIRTLVELAGLLRAEPRQPRAQLLEVVPPLRPEDREVDHDGVIA